MVADAVLQEREEDVDRVLPPLRQPVRDLVPVRDAVHEPLRGSSLASSVNAGVARIARSFRVRTPEPYLEALKRLQHIVAKVVPHKTFVDGDDVCLLYDMVTNTPAGTAFICEWYRVRGDKIASGGTRSRPSA